MYEVKDGVVGNDTGDAGRKHHSGDLLRLGDAWIPFDKTTKNSEAKKKKKSLANMFLPEEP